MQLRMHLGLVCLLAASMPAAELTAPGSGLEVHEWGTFTSVAGRDGLAMEWSPLVGPADLPCFVNHLRFSIGAFVKTIGDGLRTRIRMETPVLYFYAKNPITASVRVDFPKGLVTEWYPRASGVFPENIMKQVSNTNARGGRIEWNSLAISPNEQPEFPTEASASHYYAARETDAAPIRAGNQWEKLLFYRGIADFAPPIVVSNWGEHAIFVRNSGAGTIPLVVLFENQAGKFGYRLLRRLEANASETLAAPALSSDLSSLRRDLEAALIGEGLYAKEAHAMVETWRDSWFEAGARVFYLYPRTTVDQLLPLSITPHPIRVERVFVGRVELLRPWMEKDIRTAVAKGDSDALGAYGRFLDPFIATMQADPASKLPESVWQLVSQATAKSSASPAGPVCRQ